MSVFEASDILSVEFIDSVTTAGASEQSLAISERDLQADRDGWERIINAYLIEWGQNPGQLADEDLIPPSEDMIGYASGIAIALRNDGWPPPLRVVPDGEGGITFERRTGDVFQSLEILADKTIELSTFKDCRHQSTIPIRIDM